MQQTPFIGAKSYDIFGTDGPKKTGQALEDSFGTKSDSNIFIIDRYFQVQNTSIAALEGKVSQLETNEYKIIKIDLFQNSTSSTGSSFTGTSSEFTSYRNGYLYLLKFDHDSIGTVQFNINALGYYPLKKTVNGLVSDIEANDIKATVIYPVYYENGSFVLVGDNINSEMNRYIPTVPLATIEHDLNKYPMCDLYRTTWAAGVSGVGEGPAGGTSLVRIGNNTVQIPGSVEYGDKNSVTVYSTQEFQTYTTVNKINNNEYALLAPDSDVTHQSLVLLLY